MGTAALIGRDRELTEIVRRASEHRLVSIVGPGGVGKTALASEASRHLGARFPSGVHVIDLTRTGDAGSVAGTVASQLGFESFDALLSSPYEQPTLVVVDNCEHLLDAVASTIVQMLGASVQVSVLATSRAPLELPGESVVALAPLPLPGPVDDPRSCPAIELFFARCEHAGTIVDDRELPIAIELCRRLDGLPLAIEIAAARTRSLSLAEIVRRLGDSVDVLDRPRFRGDPRHRSVTDAIRWSYELLSPDVASVLEQLSVCAGPFTAPTAAAVVETDLDVNAAIDELVAVSLVVADTSGSETRYRLLDTVRRFALDQLERDGGSAAAHDRFVDHVLDRSQSLVAGSSTEWRPHLLRDLVASFTDIGEAMRWCVAHDDDPRRARRLAGPLWAVVHQSNADDVAELLRRLIARFPADGTTGAVQAVAVLATAEYVTGRPTTALELAEAAAAVHRHEDVVAVLLRRVLGQARNAVGDLATAVATFRDGADIGHRIGATAMADELTTAAAMVAADQGDPTVALGVLEDVLARQDPPPSPIVATWARTARAWIQARLDPRLASTEASAALAEARSLDYPIAIAVNLRTKAFCELSLGDLRSATHTLVELRDDLRRRGATSNARILVDVTAALAHRRDHPSAAVLAATARSLPITTLASSHFELASLPTSDAVPLARHDVFAAVGHVLADLSELDAAVDPQDGAPAGTADGVAESVATERRGRIERRGDLVEFEFAGRPIAVRASKGVVDIVRLVASAGVEVHCVDLAGVAVEQPSAGDLIDSTARRRYEDRIRDLHAEIEDAERDNDYTRSYRYQVELDQLIEHLTAAIGRGGRHRRSADNAERARSAVTHRIRGSIRQLERLHPPLGRHLAHSITTGFTCRYLAEQPVEWTIVSERGVEEPGRD